MMLIYIFWYKRYLPLLKINGREKKYDPFHHKDINNNRHGFVPFVLSRPTLQWHSYIHSTHTVQCLSLWVCRRIRLIWPVNGSRRRWAVNTDMNTSVIYIKTLHLMHSTSFLSTHQCNIFFHSFFLFSFFNRLVLWRFLFCCCWKSCEILFIPKRENMSLCYKASVIRDTENPWTVVFCWGASHWCTHKNMSHEYYNIFWLHSKFNFDSTVFVWSKNQRA